MVAQQRSSHLLPHRQLEVHKLTEGSSLVSSRLAQDECSYIVNGYQNLSPLLDTPARIRGYYGILSNTLSSVGIDVADDFGRVASSNGFKSRFCVLRAVHGRRYAKEVF